MSVSTTASDRARRRRESSPEPPNILSPIRRPRRERRALARFDDEDEVVQQLCGPPRLIKCTVCGQFLPRQHFTADGILHDACIECRATIPSSRLPFTDNIDALAIPQHAIDYIRNFHNECDKITVDTCIICHERWFGLDVSREGRCKHCRSSYLRKTKFTAFNDMDPGKSLGDLCEEAGIQRPEPPSHVEELL
ncbi:hypothetical protein CNBG_1229 [Cryptococcus deuterogattii R265]|uniref:uncharacterized protein n=1 Tax=Cryptococcus deuterogattii (strain R265) TaxID=294750 RepID=UPI001938EC32|nr:hypothetical protein CNBG_1229 [Cryptococcus deuterogattii R265]